MKKRKKQKLAEEISNYNKTDSCGINTDVDLLPMPIAALEHTSNLFFNRDEGGGGGRKKKSRIRKASSSINNNNNNAMVLAINQSKRVNNHVHMAIARFLLDARVPLDAVNSVYFQPMIDVIASQGAHVACPSYHDLRSGVLKASVQETNITNRILAGYTNTSKVSMCPSRVTITRSR
ncbi:hypothetical protein RND71_025467 [Anisodus tanguticus]|uniref:Uncharacterized protein n=1 Tax=Anisodus tanguticus TaxID=243964 RepID=A0AAE1RT05_9SOLA|nr:hypothetical protein RND71_025467 [Anisodus tanguticus]